MERGRNNAGWHRWQYSRKSQGSQEYGAHAGRENVEREASNSVNYPARKYGSYHKKGHNVTEFHNREKGSPGPRECFGQLEGGHTSSPRGNLHRCENEFRQFDTKDEDATEDGDEDSELYTAEEGDDEDDCTEDDSQGGEDEDGTEDLQVQILMKLQELMKAQEQSESGRVNETAGESKQGDRQNRHELKNQTATRLNRQHTKRSSSSSSAATSTNDQLNCNPGLEEYSLKGQITEGSTVRPQNPREYLGERPNKSNLRFQLPIPRNLRRFEWMVKSTLRFELGSMGYSYDGEISDRKMHGYGRLMLNNRGDIIAGNWEANRLIGLKFCQLFYRNKTFTIVRRIDDYLLTVYENHFVAVVMINSTDQLDFHISIPQFKDSFFGKVTYLEVLQDELKIRRQASLREFEYWLRDLIARTADPVFRANIFILLRRYSSDNSIFTLSDLLNDPNVPPEMKKAAINLQTCDAEYRSFYNSFAFLNEQVVPLDLKKVMANIYKVSIDQYRNILISECPNSLPTLISVLKNVDDSKIAYATTLDIAVFCQLVSQPFFKHYKECVENVVKRYGQALNGILLNTQPSSIIPIVSPVLEFLVKSLWEIISEIIEVADVTYESMLKCESGNWKIEHKFQPSKWAPKEENCNPGEPSRSSESKSLFYHRSLEVQYKVILEMLKHNFPDNRKRFNYVFCVLEQDPREENWLQKGVQLYFRKGRGLPERFKDLSDGRLVWLYILDHTIHEVYKGDPKYQDVLWQYNTLLQGTVRFIQNSPTESYESFRALTHNVVKLVTSSTPYIKVTTERLGVGADNLGVDVGILFQHISTATQNIDSDQLAFSNFRDLITEYNKYLRLRHFIEIEAAPGVFSAQLSHIMQTFMRIVESSLKKSVPITALVAYFRCLNDFLHDFKNIDFLGMWYVKTLGYGYDNQVIEKVENKLSSGKKSSYRVKNVEKFVAEYAVLDLPPPRHYIIEVVAELLGCIEKCLDKRWQSKDDELHVLQLKTTGVLLDAIRRSFMYLKEQPDYVDFKAFRKESVEPFTRLIDECSTLNDLKNRTEIVKESFWYLRKMDEIDIDQALTLLKDLNVNACCEADTLLVCYNFYLSHYNKYIETYSSALSGGKSHSEGLDAVKLMLMKVNPLHFSMWSKQYKIDKIPIILAGLSAIWSILISKDLSGTGKFLKPHCIQILCILRLLSVGQSKSSVDNHLAQVLTGQGKSVVLGLLSSILALTGYEVRVLCYSDYLSSRDKSDFKDFFQTFKITDKINYGTFEQMAEEFLNPNCGGSRKSLRQLVEDRVLSHADWSKMRSVTTNSKNTVLLIDEVDVFFSENFYGNSYCSCVRVKFSGLVTVQMEIWKLAQTKQFTVREIEDRIWTFIRNKSAFGNELFSSDLNVFLNTPGTFSLLAREGSNLTNKSYTNKTLFDEHLSQMIYDASLAASINDEYRTAEACKRNFMIDSEGMIRMRTSHNIYEEWGHRIYDYKNTFNYFRLKGTGFDHKNYRNFGYLLLETGTISYSLLPSQFRLILGVSGTIKNLGEYEKTGIRSYNIHNNTILPSFYGESNLLFNKHSDFYYYTEEVAWLRKIYYSASSVVQSNRAVLIFFESDLVIDLFTKEYRTKFDRLNEISTNTKAHLRDKYIEEAGLPGAVTLSTRVMGRGVDYKSSLSVEKHGGVHVIQTFYSKDIKEEIQIKGRTARKDNRGSYEMMICREHLVKENIISAHDRTIYNYELLDEIRQKLSAEKGRNVMDNIKRSKQDHETTMKYFGLS